MPKFLLRIEALLLVLCLVADPLIALAQPIGLVKVKTQINIFAEQALSGSDTEQLRPIFERPRQWVVVQSVQRFTRRQLIIAAGGLLAGAFGVRKAWQRWIELPRCMREGRMTDVLGILWSDSDDPRIRSAVATRAMTDAWVQSNPGFLTTRELTVLYPGSGSHVTPLDIAHQLILNRQIDEARFIYTEIEPKVVADLRQTLQTLFEAGFYSELSEATQTFDLWTETTFTMRFHGKPIHLGVAIHRSGKRYWRRDYVQAANLVYYHDVPALFPTEFLKALWTDFYGDGIDRGILYLMAEDFLKRGTYRYTSDLRTVLEGITAWDLAGAVTRVPYGFGHREGAAPERGSYDHSHANLLRFESTLLRKLTPQQYDLLVDFLETVASGVLSIRQDISLQAFSESIRMFIEERTPAGSQRRAQWLVALIRFYWAIYRSVPLARLDNDFSLDHQPNASNPFSFGGPPVRQKQRFGPWLAGYSPWLRQEASRVIDQLPAMAKEREDERDWLQAVAEYLRAIKQSAHENPAVPLTVASIGAEGAGDKDPSPAAPADKTLAPLSSVNSLQERNQEEFDRLYSEVVDILNSRKKLFPIIYKNHPGFGKTWVSRIECLANAIKAVDIWAESNSTLARLKELAPLPAPEGTPVPLLIDIFRLQFEFYNSVFIAEGTDPESKPTFAVMRQFHLDDESLTRKMRYYIDIKFLDAGLLNLLNLLAICPPEKRRENKKRLEELLKILQEGRGASGMYFVRNLGTASIFTISAVTNDEISLVNRTLDYIHLFEPDFPDQVNEFCLNFAHDLGRHFRFIKAQRERFDEINRDVFEFVHNAVDYSLAMLIQAPLWRLYRNRREKGADLTRLIWALSDGLTGLPHSLLDEVFLKSKSNAEEGVKGIANQTVSVVRHPSTYFYPERLPVEDRYAHYSLVGENGYALANHIEEILRKGYPDEFLYMPLEQNVNVPHTLLRTMIVVNMDRPLAQLPKLTYEALNEPSDDPDIVQWAHGITLIDQKNLHRINIDATIRFFQSTAMKQLEEVRDELRKMGDHFSQKTIPRAA